MSHANTSDAILAEWIGRAEPGTPPATAGSLIEMLRQSQLLTPAQVNELVLEEKRGKFPDARIVGKELIQRGSLTPFQANMLLQGRGSDLVLSPYLLLERLGEGGTGQVFKARHLRMQRVLALKVIRRELVADAETVARFYRETQVISKLAHPNLVHAYDAGPLGPTHFLAMEYVEGTDLARLVKQLGPLPIAQACDYLKQAASGLAHIHEHGLVHRDIKPSNILVNRKVAAKGQLVAPREATTGAAYGAATVGVVKILDLGLARLQEQAHGKSTTHLPDGRALTTLTLAGPVTLGTVDYLSPEQAMDFHKVDIRADIYSLGCTFYYLLTGQPPFATGTVVQKLMKHQQAEPPSLTQVRPDAPAGLDSLLRRMLAKRPEDRFATPSEIVRVLNTMPVHNAPNTSIASGERSIQAAPARRRRLVIAGIALLLFAALVGWLLLPSGNVSSTGRETPVAQGSPPRPDAPANVPLTGPATGRPTPPIDKVIEKVIRGRPLVRDALIDFAEPDRKFGTEPKNNALKRMDRSNAFLVCFDLDAAGLTQQSKITRAIFSFFVWDPHDNARTRVNVYPLKTPWFEPSVTWNQPTDGRRWLGGNAFDLKADTLPVVAQGVVQPDAVNDTVDPPVECRIDVTGLMGIWLSGRHPNHGMVVIPTADRAVDDGPQSRFQIFASEHRRVQYTPTLTVHLARD